MPHRTLVAACGGPTLRPPPGLSHPDNLWITSATSPSYPGERRAFPSTQIDTWLTLCLAHFGETPPPGEKWTGHSLRKGAASGAAAVDVALHKICWCGGWSIKSKAVFDYIDPTCPRTPACRRFFGWLAPK